MTLPLVFLLSGLAIVLAGSAMARLADTIAEVTGLGRVWIGALLLATATSLPELTTDIAAVRLGAPDLAAGDLFGSSMANMLILALVDLIVRERSVLRRAGQNHLLAAALALLLNTLAGLFVLTRGGRPVWGIDPASFTLALVYVLGMRVVWRHLAQDGELGQAARDAAGDAASRRVALRRALGRFLLATAVVLVASPAFAWSAKGIAEATGLGQTFVGTWLVGFSTSLPELVTALAAVRIGAYDLAVGNLLSSNGFNMAIFFAMDVANGPAGIFAALHPAHAVSALVAVVLMTLAIAAVVYRGAWRWSLLEPNSLVMVLVYVWGLILVYRAAVPPR